MVRGKFGKREDMESLGAVMVMGRWETGCSKERERAWREMLPSGLERGAPYLRSPLMGHPMCASWHRI